MRDGEETPEEIMAEASGDDPDLGIAVQDHALQGPHDAELTEIATTEADAAMRGGEKRPATTATETEDQTGETPASLAIIQVLRSVETAAGAAAIPDAETSLGLTNRAAINLPI